MKDKILRKIFFGYSNELTMPEGRKTTFVFPKTSDYERDIKIEWRPEDGIILLLLKRIIALEEKVASIDKKYNGRTEALLKVIEIVSNSKKSK
jgi:hypothetical protein